MYFTIKNLLKSLIEENKNSNRSPKSECIYLSISKSESIIDLNNPKITSL